MKKLLLFFIMHFYVFSPFSTAQDGQTWKWSHAAPQGNSLRWIKAWNNNNWYAVGYGGTFMKTTNAGIDWFITHKAGKMSNDGSSDLLYSAYFRNMDTGFTVGTGGVQTTIDGGETFQPLTSPLPAAAVWYQAFMLNSNIGYIAGTTSGRLAKTTDGGFSWNLNTAIPSGTYYDVATFNDTVIIVSGGSGNIQRSTDGGVTFTQISTGASATLYKVAFKDANTVYVAGGSSAVRMSTDAGATWTSINTGLPSIYFYDLDLVGNDIYLTGNQYDIYKSSDNGATWTTIGFLAPLTEQPITSVYYSTDFLADRFVAVGSYGLINLKIGSNTPACLTQLKKVQTQYAVWSKTTTGKVITVGSPSVSGVTFDQVLISTDGGSNWATGNFNNAKKINQERAVSVPDENGVLNENYSLLGTTTTFRGIEMATDSLGYIVGLNGNMYKTTDGGFTWDSLPTPAALNTSTLFDVEFINATTGWVFGQWGHVWKTTDGGLNWTQQNQSATSYAIFSASMLNETKGWYGGGSGALFFTSDGGTTWTAQNSGTTGIIYSVKALNDSVAYFAGQNLISKTTDGGTTWIPLNGPSNWSASNKIYAMDFADEMHGAIAGQGATAVGTAAVTTDGGLTWIPEFTGAATIQGICVAEAGSDTALTVYAAGNNSNIVKYSTMIVPVELTSFTAAANGNTVSLSWSTSTETNNSGFFIERKSKDNFETAAFIKGNGSTTQPHHYSYNETITAGRYIYRLKQVDFDGTFKYSDEVEINIGSPTRYELSQNFPNPFNPSTTIRYSVPAAGFIRLAVYNTLGEKIADLINQNVSAGTYEINFDTANLSSGIYFYRIEAGNYVKTMKMSVIK